MRTTISIATQKYQNNVLVPKYFSFLGLHIITFLDFFTADTPKRISWTAWVWCIYHSWSICCRLSQSDTLRITADRIHSNTFGNLHAPRRLGPRWAAAALWILWTPAPGGGRQWWSRVCLCSSAPLRAAAENTRTSTYRSLWPAGSADRSTCGWK